LNQFVWKQGIRNVPRRVRLRLRRQKDDKDESGTTWYTLASLLEVDGFSGLLTENNTGKVDK
jgi:large subunit ribosomal protein L31e